MKKILLFALIVGILNWPKIETAMAVPGAGRELFGSTIKTALTILILIVVFKAARRAVQVILFPFRAARARNRVTDPDADSEQEFAMYSEGYWGPYDA